MMIDGDEHALAGRPRPLDRVRLHMRQELVVDALGGTPQRQLA